MPPPEPGRFTTAHPTTRPTTRPTKAPPPAASTSPLEDRLRALLAA
jgi:hypothetical protein